MLARLKRFVVDHFWSARFREGGIRTWMSEPLVRRAINRRITGSEDLWPLEWFRDELGGRVFERGVSLGCGDGALERDLRRKEICRTLVGIDLSEEALGRARNLAEEEGIDGIEYRRADFNHLDLGARGFDILFFHQALHHVENLEGCLSVCRAALSENGSIYLDEYVGPSRHEWSRDLLSEAEAIYDGLPSRVRRRRRLELPIDWRDPSEAVRSSEILVEVSERFEIIERRPYGGNLLAVIYPHLDLEALAQDEREEVLQELIDAEDDLLARGAASHCMVAVGLAKGM